MTANMIEQDLVIAKLKRLDAIAKLQYERNALLSTNEQTREGTLGSVIRNRVEEQFVAALRLVRPVRKQPVMR